MKNLQCLIDFMGDEHVWRTMVPGVVIKRRITYNISSSPIAYFVDSHWTARKAYSAEIFDPYAHYQKSGTHKFCQTFAMMYLLDKLPPPICDHKEYDKCARKFIKSVIESLPDDHAGFFVDSKQKLKS
jgi:hypothetical protein